MAFPVLSINPLVEPFEQTAALDPTIRSEQEAGYVQTRPRFTRVPRKWHIAYSGLPLADKSALESHEISVNFGAGMFSWTNPIDGATHNVRYLGSIKFKPENGFDPLGNHSWSAEFDLEEV